jgi:hypothetical protein
MTEAARLRPLLSTDWKLATQVTSEARALGLTTDQVRAAREALGVTRIEGGVARRDGRWWWRLPDGSCPTCGRSWRASWRQDDQGGDYWAKDRPSSHPMADDDPTIATEAEPPSATLSPSQPAPLPNLGPPKCSICGKVSALEPGSSCPYWGLDGRRCRGTVQ